jgi:hypothetical protein
LARLVPPLRDQSATLVCGHLIFFDRALDGGLFVGRVVDDAELAPRFMLPGSIALKCTRS